MRCNILSRYLDIVTKIVSSSICNVIKQNESELANIDLQIEPIMVVNFIFILLFSASLKWLYLWNRTLNFDGGFSIIKIWNWGIIMKMKAVFLFCLIASHLNLSLVWNCAERDYSQCVITILVFMQFRGLHNFMK